ncbi:tail fiber protein [Solirubrobacter ginsenosidimutans]|uniref:Tail fiber protein n=1 Tax=Solirubrobacter ginsenosidimutans TaxID=490573 RepID=A0A9X3S6B5_9ACTN|nr:phage tail protein [Solirubrobacter ginsenosidimutans]MDA0166532.1 tail fiber protein [Solirubrobacter ginsenosidimutans]
MAQRLLLALRRQPVAFLALFVALGGSSFAAVSAAKPGTGDVIVGCVAKDGKLRVVAAASRCTAKETAISFNREGKQGVAGADGADGADGAAGADGVDGRDGKDGATGPKGATGPAGRDGTDTGVAGPAGPAGADGQSVTGTAESAGANCATGGVKYVAASGTNYVCNGATGATGASGATETAASLLTKLLTVDGTGSTLDADRLNGLSSSAFLRTTDFNSTFDTRLGTLFGTGIQTPSMSSSGSAVDCYIGQVLLTAFSYVPPGAAVAAGQTLAISQWSALFALLGTTYGGNGTTNFNLPDLRKQAPGGMTYSICVNGVWPARD